PSRIQARAAGRRPLERARRENAFAWSKRTPADSPATIVKPGRIRHRRDWRERESLFSGAAGSHRKSERIFFLALFYCARARRFATNFADARTANARLVEGLVAGGRAESRFDQRRPHALRGRNPHANRRACTSVP